MVSVLSLLRNLRHLRMNLRSMDLIRFWERLSADYAEKDEGRK